MRTYANVIEAIGRTPLIKLRRASELSGANIYGKAEFLNPGQSVKDRAALGMIRDAEKSGRLKPGGVIVEGTAGNTGIGLAVVGNALGYRTVIVMPRTQSQEKKDAVRSLGAKLVEVDAVPYANPNHYVKYSARLAEEMAKTEPLGAVWANQFDNTANRKAHYDTTGQEIWEQTDGKVDGFICAVGSGGTLGGVSMALKERNRNVQIGLADPGGASLFSYYKTLRASRLMTPGGSTTPTPCASFSTSRVRRACAWADHPGSTSRERSNWAASSDRAPTSSQSCATTATATCQSSTTALSSRKKACPPRPGTNPSRAAGWQCSRRQTRMRRRRPPRLPRPSTEPNAAHAPAGRPERRHRLD
jgi:cysteine synthase